MAKGRHVNEWPWHDFIHGRVVCCSITDLVDVTGVDAQPILTRLLNNERKTTLVTRGPYNGMFSQKTESQGSPGFPIDVPVETSTMISSGFIILQVLSDKGEHIISLDVRKESAMDYASNSIISSSYLSCLDPPKQEEEEEANSAGKIFSGRRGKERVLLLDRNYVRWYKLLGLYMADSLFG